MKSITIKRACFTFAAIISSIAIVWLTTLQQSLSQAAMIEARGANFSQRMPRIAVALTSGPEGQTDTFQEKISTKLRGGTFEVVKVSGGDANSVARQNECDYVLHTEYAITRSGIGLGQAIDTTANVLDVLKIGKLPGGRKTQKTMKDASDATNTVRKVKNVLNIQRNDKVTLKHRLISLTTASEVTKTFLEVAHSEGQVIEKLSNAVANDVLANARAGGGGDNITTWAVAKQMPPGADEGPKDSSHKEKTTPERRANSCAASAADLGDLNGLRLGMTEVELRGLVAPTARLKPGAFAPNAAGIAEVMLTPGETRTPKKFTVYQTITFNIVEGRVAMISIKYIEPYGIEDFAEAAGEKLKLPNAWEIQSGEAAMKCQGFDVRLSSGAQTLMLIDTSAFENKKKKPRI
jgi:hypothetical protein